MRHAVGLFLFPHIAHKKSKKFAVFIWQLSKSGGVGTERGSHKKSPAFAAAKGGENMNEHNRTEWEIRCAFNSFCKKAIKCEASNAHRDVRRHQLREVTLSSLSPQEESQLYTIDRYFVKEYTDNSALKGTFHIFYSGYKNSFKIQTVF